MDASNDLAPGPCLLQIRNLHIRYVGETEPALEDVSLDIGQRECIALLGASGSGKTTLAHSLLGLLPANTHISGSIVYQDRDLAAMRESEFQKIRGAEISLIHQEPELALNPVLTVGDHVTEVLRAHRKTSIAERRRRAKALLDEVGLPASAFYSSYPIQLSGGQRQRAVIAQAIACRPKLLIADEPTSGLDNLSQAEILDLIATLRRHEGLALLLITHDPLLLIPLADRVAVLDRGRIVEMGSVVDVFHEPRHERTRELLGAISLLPNESR